MSNIFKAEPSASQFLRCAFYGRYSTVMQRPASIDSQLLTCREFATGEGWVILDEHIYMDEAQSGTKKVNRTGLQALEKAAKKRPRPFDCILFDDTSRLGRDQADVLTFTKLMKFHNVKVCFVSQRLDSSDDNFPVLLNSFSMVDELYVSRQRVRVFNSQKERVMKGFHVGSVPYGYRAVRIENASNPAAVGQAATLGTKLEIVKDQAEIVLRIFQLFVDGHAMYSISRQLNRQRIPSPQNIRAGSTKNEWSHDAICHILCNTKYRGENVWNRSRQTVDPETGRVHKEYKPPHDHVRVKLDYLRIVDDELWYKVEELLKKNYGDKQATRVRGGYSRAANGLYLFSGLLYCGCCDSRLKIDGKQGKGVYVCKNYRLARDCTNSIRVPEVLLTKQLVDALSDQMFDPSYLNALVEEVYGELQAAWRKQMDQVSKEQIPQLLREKTELQERINKLIDLIETGGPAGLLVRLETRQWELTRVDAKLKAAQGKTKLATTKEELRKLVYQSVENLVGVLKEDVTLARMVLHKHIKKLRVFSYGTAGKSEVFVTGEVDFFRNSPDGNKCVLLRCEDILTPQQHTDFYYCFAMPLYLHLEECLLAEPLRQLLLAQPELSLEPKTPGTWARLLRGVIADNWDEKRSLGSGAIGRCFGRHRHILEPRFNIIKGKHTATNGWHYQISIRPNADMATGVSPIDEAA